VFLLRDAQRARQPGRNVETCHTQPQSVRPCGIVHSLPGGLIIIHIPMLCPVMMSCGRLPLAAYDKSKRSTVARTRARGDMRGSTPYLFAGGAEPDVACAASFLRTIGFLRPS
jgi:hypothetical protein